MVLAVFGLVEWPLSKWTQRAEGLGPARGRMRAVGVRSCGRMRAAAGGTARWRNVRAATWWTASVHYRGALARLSRRPRIRSARQSWSDLNCQQTPCLPPCQHRPRARDGLMCKSFTVRTTSRSIDRYVLLLSVFGLLLGCVCMCVRECVCVYACV